MRIAVKFASFLGLVCAFSQSLLYVSASTNHSNTNTESHLYTKLDMTGTGLANMVRPPQELLDVENYPIAPEGLELKQVHVYVRHGERAPVGVRLADPPASIPAHWMLCKTARQFRATVAGSSDLPEGVVPMRRFVERKDGTSAEEECLLGELTDVGRKSTFEYGVNLRKLYIDRLGFLPDVLGRPEQAYFRSTNMPRTMESLQHIISGLYPLHKCPPNNIPPIRIRNGKDENLLGNTFTCKRLELLQIGFARAAATKFNPMLEPLDKQLSKYIGGLPIRVDGKPRTSGIMDTVRAAMAHGIEVPPEFHDNTVVDLIETAVVNEWFSDRTEEVRRLGMGLLLSDLSSKMQNKIEFNEADPTKILVHSTHDTAIAALASTLDVFDDKWPAFTASITFELFSHPRDSSPSYLQSLFSPFQPPNHYVRMRYQNKNMVLPFCGSEGKHLPGHPEFCTFAAFQARVKELTPLDWDAECTLPT